MRGVFAAGLLLFGALFACGQQSRDSVMLLDGGFAPGGSNFRITFGFSDLAVAPGSAKNSRELAAPGTALPACEWSSAHGATAQLEICCARHSMGLTEGTLVAARLRLVNSTDRPFKTTLAVAIAPQGAIHALSFDKHAFFIDGRVILVADTPSRGAILAASPFEPRPLTPQDQAHVESVEGECRAEMLFDLVLMPGQTQTLGFICPVRLPGGKEPGLDFYRGLPVEDLFTAAKKDAAAH